VVSSTPRPHFTPGKDPVPILQEAGWAPGPVWKSGKSRPHRGSILDLLASSSVGIPTELRSPTSEMYRIKILATIPTTLLVSFTGFPKNLQNNEGFFVVQGGAVKTKPYY